MSYSNPTKGVKLLEDLSVSRLLQGISISHILPSGTCFLHGSDLHLVGGFYSLTYRPRSGPSLRHWRPWAKQCTEARGHTNFNGQLNKICRCRPYLYCNYSNFKLLVLISTV